MLQSGDRDKIVASLAEPDPPFESKAIVKNAWNTYTALADRYNDPGRFSEIIGFEYTTMGGFNLHRNVLFRGDSSEANKMLPFSQFDSQNPEDLWAALAKFKADTGHELLAIPHNGNLSNGRMFSVNKFDGVTPYDKELAELRASLEPIHEVTQIKGDSEAHPMLSPNDEYDRFA